MKILKPIAFFILLGGLAACSKPSGTTSSADLSASGTLEAQGVTTYQYGTNVLVVSSSVSYVLESTTIDLSPYVGRSVTITAVQVPHAEVGPNLYNVTYIAAE